MKQRLRRDSNRGRSDKTRGTAERRTFGENWEKMVLFKTVFVIGGVTLLGAVSGCASGSLFGFPVEQGDIAAGRQAFIDHRCHQCHSIAGERLPPLAGADRPILELGGQTTHVRSY